MPELSSRITSLKASSTVAFNSRAKALVAQGVDVIAMTAGEPDFQPPAHVMEAAHRGIDLGITKYTPSEGSLELREAVAAKFTREKPRVQVVANLALAPRLNGSNHLDGFFAAGTLISQQISRWHLMLPT